MGPGRVHQRLLAFLECFTVGIPCRHQHAHGRHRQLTFIERPARLGHLLQALAIRTCSRAVSLAAARRSLPRCVHRGGPPRPRPEAPLWLIRVHSPRALLNIRSDPTTGVRHKPATRRPFDVQLTRRRRKESAAGLPSWCTLYQLPKHSGISVSAGATPDRAAARIWGRSATCI
jgi:hypothetical protein